MEQCYTDNDAISILKEVLGPLVMRLQQAQDRKLYDVLMSSLDHSLVEYALELEGNQLAAAELLGISRNTLRRKIRKYNLTLEKGQRRNRRSS